MIVLKMDSEFAVKRLDLIPNDPKKPTGIKYYVDILVPKGFKLERVNISRIKFIVDPKDTKKVVKAEGNTTIIEYKAYEVKDSSVEFSHIEKDSDEFLGFPHQVIVIVYANGGEASKVSDIID